MEISLSRKMAKVCNSEREMQAKLGRHDAEKPQQRFAYQPACAIPPGQTLQETIDTLGMCPRWSSTAGRPALPSYWSRKSRAHP
jgi:hypothetical protein